MSKDNLHEAEVVDNLPLVNIDYIYNPRFHLIDLISTRRRPFASAARNPPRPPNSFFLMKNCLLLELKLRGCRLTMPCLCKMARGIWKDIPQDVKDRYDALAVQAQILHQRVYPDYRFAPKKRTKFKQFVPPNSQGMGAFSSVSSVITSSPLESLESSSSSSSPSPTPQHSGVYLPVLPDSDFYIYNEYNVNVIDNNIISNNYNDQLNVNYSDYFYYPY
jgi:hypothetical protein